MMIKSFGKEEEYCSLLSVGVALDLKIFSFPHWIMVMILKAYGKEEEDKEVYYSDLDTE